MTLHNNLKHRATRTSGQTRYRTGLSGWVSVRAGSIGVTLGSVSLKCPTRVHRNPAEGSPEGMSYLGQEDEASGQFLPQHCSSHNPEGYKICYVHICPGELKEINVRMYVKIPTCVSISCGIVCCWIQG